MLEEEIGVLTRLGLTQVQSKVFLALSKLGCSPINKISEVSTVPRQDIYRVVTQLQELSLVQKILTKPVRYQATFMDEACVILLNRKKEDYVNLKRMQKKFLKSFNDKRKSSSVVEQEYEFFVVKGKEAIFKNIKENFTNSKSQIDIATTQERFLQSITYLGPEYKKKLQEGVAIRVVTEKPVDEQSFLAYAEDFMDYSNFVIRYVQNPLKAIAIIFDKKAAGAAMRPNESLLKSPVIHTNNPAFLTMFSEYFEQVWRSGSSYRVLKSRLPG